MVELQNHIEDFENNDIWICAISYDPVEVLGEFAKKFAITYPLLADVDSAVIRLFDILNTHIPESHPWYGVPFPGTFMVDEQGIVVDKSFYANHGVRDSVARMLQENFQVHDVNQAVLQTAETDPVKASARLSSKTVRPGQVITFTIEIEIEDGCYMHAHPLPQGYIPATLTFEEVEEVHFGEVVYPEPGLRHLNVLDETLHIYAGRIELKVAVRNRRKESFVLRAHLQYQVCDQVRCHLPAEINFELEIECLENVRG